MKTVSLRQLKLHCHKLKFLRVLKLGFLEACPTLHVCCCSETRGTSPQRGPSPLILLQISKSSHFYRSINSSTQSTRVSILKLTIKLHSFRAIVSNHENVQYSLHLSTHMNTVTQISGFLSTKMMIEVVLEVWNIEIISAHKKTKQAILLTWKQRQSFNTDK